MLEEADTGVMLWLLRKAVWDDDGPRASPADEAGLMPAPGVEKGLGCAALVTDGKLPWEVRLLLVPLLKKEPRLPRLFRLCSPADAPGLCTASGDTTRVYREVNEDKDRKRKNNSSVPILLPSSTRARHVEGNSLKFCQIDNGHAWLLPDLQK